LKESEAIVNMLTSIVKTTGADKNNSKLKTQNGGTHPSSCRIFELSTVNDPEN
jgi:hypothetical protein